MKRLIPGFLLAALLGAVAFFVAREDAGGFAQLDVPSQDASASAEPLRDGFSELEAPEGGSPAEEEPELRELVPDGEDSGAPARPGKRLQLQLWERKFGVPASGATVFFWADPSGPAARGDAFTAPWSERAEEHGERFTADEDGRLELPGFVRTAVVSASSASSFAFKRVWQWHPEKLSLVLQADATVTIRVRDARGAPLAGVPVALMQAIPERGMSAGEIQAELRKLEASLMQQRDAARGDRAARAVFEKRVEVLQQYGLEIHTMSRQRDGGVRASQALERLRAAFATGRDASKGAAKGARPAPRIRLVKRVRARRRTDASGEAVIRHVQLLIEKARAWWPEEARMRFAARLLVPLQEEVEREFGGDPFPGDAIELVMPPSGSLRLRMVDRDGRPFAHPVRARLQLGAESARRFELRKANGEDALVFEHVGVGLELRAHCRLDDDDFRWVTPVFAGPRRAGEAREVDVVVAPEDGAFVGRVLGVGGGALGGERLSFLLTGAAGRIEGEQITLDAEARFHLPFKLREPQAPFRLEVRDLQGRAGLVRALPRLDARAIVDLGDLELEEMGRVAHGRVLDDRGEAIAGASVQLQRERPRGRGQRYSDEAYVRARSDEAGGFELFGSLETGRYRLRVQAAGHLPLETETLRSGAPVELRLQRRARVVAIVKLPEWLPVSRLRARLESVGEGAYRRDARLFSRDGKAYAIFDGLRAASYRFALILRELPDPLFEVRALSVPAGQRDPLPQLASVDLRQAVHRYALRAVDAEGKLVRPDAPLLAEIARADGSTAMLGFAWKASRIEIVTKQASLRIRPLARGYRVGELFLAPGERDVVFERVAPLELHLPGLRAALGDTAVTIALERVRGTSSDLPRSLTSWDGGSKRMSAWYNKTREWLWGAGGKLGADERVRIELSRPGRFIARAFLHGGGKKRVMVPLGELDVPLQLGRAAIRRTLRPDLGAVRAALQSR